MPTKTATRRRTAIPQWFPVSVLSVLPQQTCSGPEVLENRGHVEHVKPLESAFMGVKRAGYSGFT